MDYAVFVGMVQGVQYLARNVYSFLWGNASANLYIFLEGHSLNVFQHNVAYAVLVCSRVVRLYYIGMGQGNYCACFSLKASQKLHILLMLILKHFDGNCHAGLFIIGLIYVSHAAGTNQSIKAISSGKKILIHHHTSLSISATLTLSVDPP